MEGGREGGREGGEGTSMYVLNKEDSFDFSIHTPPSLPPSLPPITSPKPKGEYVATEMFVFGGYSPTSHLALNDTLLLSYLVQHGREGGREEGRFVWSRPEVEGQPPHARLGHGCVIIPGTEAEGGDR